MLLCVWGGEEYRWVVPQSGAGGVKVGGATVGGAGGVKLCGATIRI